MNSIITLAICVILVLTIAWALIKGVWAASKKIILPIQIVLFVVILVCIGRMLFTKENAKKLYEGIEQSGVSRNIENTVRSALPMEPVAMSAPVAASEILTVEVTSEEISDSSSVDAVAVPASVSKTAPVVESDYSRLDKGKKTFSYASPFGAQVKVGFRDGTYRIIAESIGMLGTSDKKEIGKMVIKALSEYSEENVSGLDKSQVKIEAKYDDIANRTRVFVIVPPSAIN